MHPRVVRLLADGAMAGRIAAASLVALALPETLWRPLTRAVGAASVRMRPGWTNGRLAELERRLGEGEESARRDILVDQIAFGHESRLHGLREYRPGRRKHRIQLAGAQVIHDALADGKGAILWVAPFMFASLVSKIALHEAGFTVSHLSRTAHGFSESPRAVRWMNPIWTRIEERYLRERIVMSPENQTTALRMLRARLSENQIVSIAAGNEGSRVATVPFIAGELTLASGAVSLATKTGAPLIPVFTVRTESGEFAVEMQAPLDCDSEVDRAQRLEHVVAQYADRLTPFVERYPGQWLA